MRSRRAASLRVGALGRLGRSCARGLGLLLAVFWLIPARAESTAARLAAVRVRDLAGQSITPFCATNAVAEVFFFVSVECPISNAYVPEYRRLAAEFMPRGVTFKLVYPNPDETEETIRQHLKAYDCSLDALCDPRREFVKAAGVRVTPEAAIYVHGRGQVYRGRVDDRYVELGRARPEAREHDVRDVLTQILGGKSVTPKVTRAIGCVISEAP